MAAHTDTYFLSTATMLAPVSPSRERITVAGNATTSFALAVRYAR